MHQSTFQSAPFPRSTSFTVNNRQNADINKHPNQLTYANTTVNQVFERVNQQNDARNIHQHYQSSIEQLSAAHFITYPLS
jgi:hypothetical protein